LGINRSSLYYKSKPESEENLKIMRLSDELFLNQPTYGVLQTQDYLKAQAEKKEISTNITEV